MSEKEEEKNCTKNSFLICVAFCICLTLTSMAFGQIWTNKRCIAKMVKGKLLCLIRYLYIHRYP